MALHSDRTCIKKTLFSWFETSVAKKMETACPLLEYCASNSGNVLPTFRDKLSVPSSRIMNSKFGKELSLLAT
jgi:hypothetical protein